MCSDSCPIIDTPETYHVNTKGFGFPLHSQSVLHCRSPWLTLGFSLQDNIKYRLCAVKLMVSFLGSMNTRFGVEINFLH